MLLDQLHRFPLEFVRKRSSRPWHVCLLNTSCHSMCPGNRGKPSKPRIRHGFDRAAYAPRADQILMPDVACFTSPEAYCATALHELVHWTGHPDRLGRNFSQRFGDAAYAFGELVAKLGSAFVLGHTGLVEATIEGHAAYLDHWLQVLRNDRTAIFTAAPHACQAFEYILAREMPSHDHAQCPATDEQIDGTRLPWPQIRKSLHSNV
ncbi:zincin-like metallopeptidase domain-containing protein [Variovorax sp. UMC13]|uniref:zincin-like metallopeptidase domain-containing protein n=1 Tax=Variovorax sp. UMC13 TaxID=1862326 RepID=UPI0015FF671D|nr:zincin-like metallopeptidase domain-containing protein [Variovorax sp. UMC13]